MSRQNVCGPCYEIISVSCVFNDNALSSIIANIGAVKHTLNLSLRVFIDFPKK
jgi:hypothetical protein